MLLDRLGVPHPEQLRLLWCTESDDVAVKGFWGYFDGVPGGPSITTSFSYPSISSCENKTIRLRTSLPSSDSGA
jgi:hypothetical protein